MTSRWTTNGWMTAGLASRGRRLLSAAVAIVIGVAFLTASLVVLATAKAGVEQSVAAGIQDADLVVSLEGDSVPAAAYDAVAALDGVGSVRGEGYVSGERGPRDWVYGGPLPVSGVTLLSGQMPAADGEVLISTALADEGLAPGEELELAVPTGAEEARSTSLTVSGVADFGGADIMLSYGPTFAASDATLREIDPDLTYQLLAVELSGADDAAAREALTAAVREAATGGREDAAEPLVLVQTGAEAAEERVASLTGDTAVFAAILLGFGAVALLTAAIVIANTFTITLAQRTAELALLRCVGATRGQVRCQVVLEAVVLGVVASVVGVGVGTGVGAGLLALGRRVDLGIPLEVGLQVGALSLAVPVVVGTLVTVLASLWPAVRATRVSPLAALRPAGPAADRRRVGWVRLGVAVLLVGAGAAAMVYAATEREILAGIAGGVVSFAGVLVAAVVIVPAAVHGLGLAARVAGVPGRLAVDNAVRNPGRAAATSAALLVGVTLITMTSVGAATGQRTALGEIDRAYAVDFLLTTDGESRPGADAGAGADSGDGAGSGAAADGDDLDTAALAESGPLPVALEPSVPDTLAAVDGIAAVTPVDTAYVVLGESWGGTRAVGLDPATAGDTMRSETLVASVGPDTVGLSNLGMVMLEVEPGDTLPVTGAAGARDLTVIELGLGSSVVLHEDTLADLAGDDVRTGGALLRLADDAEVAAVMSDVNDVADDHGLLAEGAAVERAVVVQVLDILVMVTTALLGAAVVIAVVGIANTLSLSVVERHREHALLRGLGLTRGQMRGMLLTEGVLLALVSAVLGLLLGLGYAVLGIQTLLPADTTVQLAVPWARVGIIVGLALVAGVLASVLPARRATRVSPAEGLAAA
ncbi:FtsX-like permease family protein [Ornithinimicrobium pekingense]|nr:FtsX family ABC transporter permease [Ornithinimicrobium pekingense]